MKSHPDPECAALMDALFEWPDDYVTALALADLMDERGYGEDYAYALRWMGRRRVCPRRIQSKVGFDRNGLFTVLRPTLYRWHRSGAALGYFIIPGEVYDLMPVGTHGRAYSSVNTAIQVLANALAKLRRAISLDPPIYCNPQIHEAQA